MAQVRGYCYFYGVGQTRKLNSRTIVRVLLFEKMYRYKKVDHFDPEFDSYVVVLVRRGFFYQLCSGSSELEHVARSCQFECRSQH